MTLDHTLFKGASIQFKNAGRTEDHMGILSALPIKNIWPKKLYYLPEEDVIWTGQAGGHEYIRNVKRQTGNDTFTPHTMTQVDKLREEGITGKGIKIAVIDTGVCTIALDKPQAYANIPQTDYNHPALGGGFGPGHLVSYGTDLVGDDYDGENTPVPDDE